MTYSPFGFGRTFSLSYEHWSCGCQEHLGTLVFLGGRVALWKNIMKPSRGSTHLNSWYAISPGGWCIMAWERRYTYIQMERLNIVYDRPLNSRNTQTGLQNHVST